MVRRVCMIKKIYIQQMCKDWTKLVTSSDFFPLLRPFPPSFLPENAVTDERGKQCEEFGKETHSFHLSHQPT